MQPQNTPPAAPSKNRQPYEQLKRRRPSITRVTALTWLGVGLGSLLALACLVLAAAIVIDVTVSSRFIAFISNQEPQQPALSTRRIGFFIAGALALVALLLYVIVSMSRKLLRRNNYIMELEQLMDKEMGIVTVP